MKCICSWQDEHLALCDLHAKEATARVAAALEPILKAGDAMELVLRQIAVATTLTLAQKEAATLAVVAWYAAVKVDHA